QEEEMYYVTVRAWARGTGESRRLWWGKLYGETAIEELRERYAVPQNCVVVDSGHWAKGPAGVYAACIKYRWIAAKGDEARFFWHTIKLKSGATQRVQKPWAPLTWGDPGSGT